MAKKKRKAKSKGKWYKRKIVIKTVLKTKKPTLVINKPKQTNVFDEPSHFFDRELEETKKSMFL